MKKSSNFPIFVAAFVVFVLCLFTFFRFVTPEDDWICQKGEWVKHGNPAADKPTKLCPGAKINPASENNEVFVYYNNSQKAGSDTDCGLVYPIKRTVSEYADNLYSLALNELFQGPSKEEMSKGYNSMFSSKTSHILLSLKVDGDKAYVNLTDIRNLLPSASASCGSSSFLSQIEETLKHDRKIKQVFYAINGNPAEFYEWIQVGCDKELNNCDPKPFQ